MDKIKKEKRPDSLDPKSTHTAVIKPITVSNVLYYYCPIIGTTSYTLLSINVLNPALRFSFLAKRDLTNVLLVNSVIGIGCYVYSRPHLKLATDNSRFGFSAFGSMIFTFSSVLFWALLRSLLPENVAICSAVGVATSYIFVKGATNYLEFVDSKIGK
ncbi:UNVERIFIED_CONTAM: hypothetical protein PYX00_004941 [Menopon gallinae]|uniref:Uncharacterized protein n=1 Tax=Menopon gallinae TaxID=328185 RepID=A0AAW2I5W5_9NEOP